MVALFGLGLLALIIIAAVRVGMRIERARATTDATIAAFFDEEAVNDAADSAITGDDWR